MKKWLLVVVSLVLVGCGAPDTAETTTIVDEPTAIEADAELVEVIILITVDGEVIEDGEQTIEVNDGAFLLDVMDENFNLVQTDSFISSINGYKQNEATGKYWLFDVNGVMAEVGAAEFELHDDDVVEWTLEAFEG